MKNRKNFMKLGFLFILLFFVAATPILLTEYDNMRLLNRPIVTVMPDDYLNHQKQNTMQSFERIKMIINANNQKTGIITEQKVDIAKDKERLGEIVKKIEEQMQILQTKNAIPTFDIANTYYIKSINKTMYMDSMYPEQSVGIWEILLIYTNVSVEVWVDVETNMLYLISLFSDNETFNFDISNISEKNFLEYISNGTENIKFHKKEELYDNSIKNRRGYFYLEKEGSIVEYYYTIEKKYIAYYLMV